MNTELFQHFYSFFKRLDPKAGEEVWAGAAFTVQLSQEGHSCLPLAEYAGKVLFDADFATGIVNMKMPELDQWRTQFETSRLVAGPHGQTTPLVLDDGDNLYMARNYDYERRLAAEIMQRTGLNGHSVAEVASALPLIFDSVQSEELDWQKVAVATAALKKICVISGGPGTGKTYTVVKIMTLLQMLETRKVLRFGLVAPTGKAASRLQESIQQSLAQHRPEGRIGQLDSAIEASTIHRLLGVRRHSHYFWHDKNNPLALDVLIVDEVSMVDLAMMVKLLEAMPLSGRVILLGDKDQLSSVESGRVLADICEGAGNCFSAFFADKLADAGAVSVGSLTVDDGTPSIQDCLVFLEKSFRFAQESPIGRLAQAVLQGRADEAGQCLEEENTAVALDNFSERKNMLATKISTGYSAYLSQKDPAMALDRLKNFRVLCAHRHGVSGVAQVNRWVESVLFRENKIEKQGEWYGGRPVMITGNHYSMELYNGDIGLAFYDETGRLRIWFETGDGRVRSFSPSRIPAHETAYAMTVHKSQGSEFDHVVLILPEQPSRLITRELLYTAITRAKKIFELWGSKAVFEEGVRTVTQRSTGLAEKIFDQRRASAMCDVEENDRPGS